VTDVSAAIIEKDGKVLICKRAGRGEAAHLWEFPGGKREAGETSAACLARECAEELGIEIATAGLLAEVDWPGSADHYHFRFFAATVLSGEAEAREHEEIRWVAREALRQYVFCPADASILDQVIQQ